MNNFDITIFPNQVISDAMKKLNKSAKKCLLVVDTENNFLGTLTDGDMRRSILNGSDFNEKISNSFNKNSTFVLKDKLSKNEILDLMLKKK